MIRKLALIIFVSIAGAATNEMVIQPLLRSAAENSISPLAITRGGGSNTSAMSAPVSGFLADPSQRGLVPIMGLRMNAFIGQLIALGGQTVSAISSPNQNYVVTIDGNQTAWFWLNAGAELAQAPLPADVTQTSAAVPSPGAWCKSSRCCRISRNWPRRSLSPSWAGRRRESH
jgi:hypothetical protein